MKSGGGGDDGADGRGVGDTYTPNPYPGLHTEHALYHEHNIGRNTRQTRSHKVSSSLLLNPKQEPGSDTDKTDISTACVMLVLLPLPPHLLLGPRRLLLLGGRHDALSGNGHGSRGQHASTGNRPRHHALLLRLLLGSPHAGLSVGLGAPGNLLEVELGLFRGRC